MRKDLLVAVSILSALSLLLFFLSRVGLYPFWFLGKTVLPSELSLLQNSVKSDTSSQLQKENTALLSQLSNLKKIQEDNSALHDQFSTTQLRTKTLLPATIVGEPRLIPGVSLPSYLILDKGSDDGVKKEQIVLYKDSFIGRISEVNPGFSKVVLLSDSSNTITVRTQDSNALGVLKGQSNGELLFDNVLLSDVLKIGDFVVTNGDQQMNGNGYPPGILLGRITSVDKNPSALFQKASVEPLITVSKLRIVFILVQ